MILFPMYRLKAEIHNQLIPAVLDTRVAVETLGVGKLGTVGVATSKYGCQLFFHKPGLVYL